MSVHPAAARGFDHNAEVYERARPGYPAGAVAWLAGRLGLARGRTVLDLAAGTGKLTRLLVPTGAAVVAVEPLSGMRAELERAAPGATILAGTAETIPLADGSVDAVVVAQAFHWFRADEALAEIHRVLAPGGGLALIFNERDAGDPLQAALSEIVDRHERDYVVGERWRESLVASELFGPLEERRFVHAQELTAELVVDRVSSMSFIAGLPAADRDAALDEVGALVAGRPEPISFPYVTEGVVLDAKLAQV